MTDPFTVSRAEHLRRLPIDLAGKALADMTREELARYQHHMAQLGEAVGQCEGCGAYRADGAPPILHRPECARSDADGRAL